MRPLVLIVWLLVPTAVGCYGHPYFANQQQYTWQQKRLTQMQEYQQRAGSLDVNNRDLHTQLAQSQQEVRDWASWLAVSSSRSRRIC